MHPRAVSRAFTEMRPPEPLGTQPIAILGARGQLGAALVAAYGDRPLLTPARRQTMAEQDRMQRAATAFEEDPTVKGLRERFGAEVDAGSIKPLS